MWMAEKVRENRLRRMANRQGLALQKSRRRDPYALEYGNYWLVNPQVNAVIAGGKVGVSLDDVEEWLTTPREATNERSHSRTKSESA